MVQKRKTAARRSAASHDVVRTFSVRLPGSVLASVKAKADNLGLKLQGVSRQALELWASDGVQRDLLQPFGQMNADERRTLTAVLDVMRGGDADMQAIVRAVVKRHTREAGGGGRAVGAGS